jgi:hypothetical protein
MPIVGYPAANVPSASSLDLTRLDVEWTPD